MDKIKNYIIIVLCIVIVFLVVNITIANADKQYAINNYMRVQEEKTELLNINAEIQNKADGIVEQDNITNNSDTKE